MTPGQVLKEFRTSRGITVAAWANKYGVAIGTVQRFESGTRRVSPDFFVRVMADLKDSEIRQFGIALCESIAVEYGIISTP